MATTVERSTVVSVFDTREQAHQAVEELHRAGFAGSNITAVMHRDVHGDVELTDLDATKAGRVSGEPEAKEGGVGGLVAGGLVGGALGVAAAAIPGLTVLAIPTLAAAAFGVAAGAAGGGVVGGLVGQDFPEEHAHLYEQELKAGHV